MRTQTIGISAVSNIVSAHVRKNCPELDGGGQCRLPPLFLAVPTAFTRNRFVDHHPHGRFQPQPPHPPPQSTVVLKSGRFQPQPRAAPPQPPQPPSQPAAAL